MANRPFRCEVMTQAVRALSSSFCFGVIKSSSACHQWRLVPIFLFKAKPRGSSTQLESPPGMDWRYAGIWLAALMYRWPIFDLPPVFATIAENVARLETMQAHAGAVRAVAEAVERSEH